MSRWTDEEVFLLKEHFPTTPKNYMSEEILADRTAEAISRKARRLDLTKEDNFYFKWKVQQQTKPNRNKKLENFIIGFTAGDGTFMKTKNEDRYKFTYKLEMNAPQNREMMNEIKDFFGCGRISEYQRSD